MPKQVLLKLWINYGVNNIIPSFVLKPLLVLSTDMIVTNSFTKTKQTSLNLIEQKLFSQEHSY